MKKAQSFSPSRSSEQYSLKMDVQINFASSCGFSGVVDSTPLQEHAKGRSQVRFLAEPDFCYNKVMGNPQ